MAARCRLTLAVVAAVVMLPVVGSSPFAQSSDAVFLRVIAAETGQPLRGVTVGNRSLGPVALLTGRAAGALPGRPPGVPPTMVLPPPLVAPPLVAAAKSDADGWVRVSTSGVAAGLLVVKPGYVRRILPTAIESGTEIALVRAGALTVRVVDASGEPVHEARVVIRCSGGANLSTPTDDRGERRFSGITPGRCALDASPPQSEITLSPAGPQGSPPLFRPMEASPGSVQVDVPAGGDIAVTMTLPASAPVVAPWPPPLVAESGTASIHGVIRGPDQRPLAGMSVAAVPPGQGFDLNFRFQTTTDPAGRYALTVPPGLYALVVRCPCRGLLLPEPPRQVLDAGRQQAWNVDLQRGAVLTGRVVDEFGDPEEGVQVLVFDTHALQQQVYGAITDDRGTYRVAAMRPGTYRVSVRPPASASGTEQFYAGTAHGRLRGDVEIDQVDVSGVDFTLAPAAGRGRLFGR